MSAPPRPADRARRLLNKYGGEIDDFFKLWPADKDFFFSGDGQAFLAYRVKHGVAVCTFDPVGPDKSVASLLDEFYDFCASKNWLFIFVQTTDKHDQDFSRHRARRITIGADALVPTGQFTSETARNKYFRNINNRFSKAGYATKRYLPPHSAKLLGELKTISDDWLRLPHHEEWQFLTGRFDADYLQRCPLYVLRDKAGVAQAFVTELPSFKKGVGSIDLIRHRRDAKPNSIDFLLVRLIGQYAKDGVPEFNLGLSPLAGQPFSEGGMDRFIQWFYGTFQSFMRFKGLHQFKSKYHPQWEARYIYTDASVRHLPRMGWAIMRLMGRYQPPGVPRRAGARRLALAVRPAGALFVIIATLLVTAVAWGIKRHLHL